MPKNLRLRIVPVVMLLGAINFCNADPSAPAAAASAAAPAPQAAPNSANSKTPTASSTPSSGDKAKPGDYVQVNVDTPAFKDSAGKGVYCAPIGSLFVIDSTVSNGSGQADTLNVHFQRYPVGEYLHRRPGIQQIAEVERERIDASITTKRPCAASGVELVTYPAEYTISTADLSNVSSQRAGFSWGAMVIPYKFELKDRTFKGQPSTVVYLGYEGWFAGETISFVTALGPGISSNTNTATTTTTSTSSTSTTTTGSSNQTALTYTAAIGLVASFGNSIKAGALVGKDWQGSNTNFAYEGRTWLAISIGTSF